MMGELNYKEWEIWETTWKGIVLSLTGLRDKDYSTESLFRRVAAACVGSGSNKKLAQSFTTSFWPDSRKKKRKTILDPQSPQARQLARFKEMEATKNLMSKK